MLSGVAVSAVIPGEGTFGGEVLAFGAVGAGDCGGGLGVCSDRAVCASLGLGGTVCACVGVAWEVERVKEGRETGVE